MNVENRLSRLCALVLSLALLFGLCYDVPVRAAEIAPARPSYKDVANEEAEAVPDEEDFDENAYIAEEEGGVTEDAPIEVSSEEEQFLTALLGELDIPENALDAINGMTNILLVGIDARPKEKTGRSDTMIIMTLDKDHKCIKLTTLMRDLYVEIPGRGSNRLNAAYVWGGPELLKRTIKQNFGVDIDYYVTVNFFTLAEIIDQLGGVEVTVEEKYLPRVNAVIKMDNKALRQDINIGLVAEAGTQVLTGRQAVAYARYRYYTPDGDSGRAMRQREIIFKLIDMVKDKSLVEIGELVLKNIDNVPTDLTLGEVLKLAPAVLELKSGAIRELRIPIDGGFRDETIRGMMVFVPNRSKNAKALHDFIMSDPAVTPQVTQRPVQ